MTDVATQQLAFRVALIAGALWLVSTLAEPLHFAIGVLLLAVASWLAWVAFRTRTTRRAFEAAICAAGGGILVTGIAPMIAMPMFALACVCAALGVIAMLGSHETAANDD
jgi:hypothetical protein